MPCNGNNEIEVPNPPKVTGFRCPRCDCSFYNETADGLIRMKPPVCQMFHKPTEMEQVLLDVDA
jgi:hypothetical protein